MQEIPFFGRPSVLRMRNPVMILSYILPLASSALLLVMTCSAVLKKPALPLEKLRIVPFLIALVGLVFFIYVTSKLQGFSVDDMLFRGTFVGWILNLLPFALTPNWLIGDMVRERNDAAASAADKNKQVEFYRDLMNKGAITPEEFEEKRRRIEGE
ncbi:MAG: SHOCT domain-containing protein [Oscillospiraceae bacterium]|nr:SHOCT domain-containing protein [Oscillospiraceae bacterium]